MSLKNCSFVAGIIASVAISAVTAGADEVYARAFVKNNTEAGPVYIYDVSEDGLTWTRNREFCSRRSKWPIRRVMQVNHIVYVLEAADSTAETAAGSTGVKGYVYRYRPDGTFIDQYLEFDGCANSMAITPDGRYIIIGNGEGTYTGKLRRYDTVLNEWNHDFGTDFGEVREMCADDDGFIYITSRLPDGLVYKLRADHSGDAYTPYTYEAKSPAFDLVGAVCLNPFNGNLYAGGRKGFASFSTNDLTQIINITNTVPGQTEWSTLSTLLGEKMYFGSWYQKCVYEVDRETCLNTKVTADFQRLYAISDCPTPEYRRWSFDESAGYATSAGGVALCAGACVGIGGVKGNSLCFAEDGSYAALSDTRDLFSGTVNFTLAFSALVPEGATNGHCLVSNDAGQSNTLSVVVGPDAADNGKLALVYTPVPGEDSVSIVSDVSIADGKWHHIGVTRKDNTSLVLRLDGEVVGTVNREGGFKISSAWDWHIGSNAGGDGEFVPAGTAVDEVGVYMELSSDDLSLVPADWIRWRVDVAAATIPSVPEAVERTAQPLPAPHGTQIFHSFADDASIASPNVFRSSDGIWYATCERGNSKSSTSQVTRIWTSADGAAWTLFGTIKASSVSLFQLPNKTELYAIGMEGYRKCAVWRCDRQEDGKPVWTELACVTDSENFEIASGEVGFAFNRISRPLVMRDESYCGKYRCGCLFFAYDTSGAFRSGTISKSGSDTVEMTSSFSSLSSIKSMYPASTTFSWFDDGNINQDRIHALYPIVRGMPNGRDFPISPAGCYYGSFYQWWNVEGDAAGEPIKGNAQSDASSGVTFPGADRPFTVKYDDVSKVYRALTTPDNERIEMFESDDLWGWRPCGTVLGAGEGVSYSSPSFVIDGDDLVIVYSVGCDDGAGGPRSGSEGNYFACRRVEDFRTNFTAEKESLQKVIVCGLQYGGHGGLFSFWRRENGELLSDSKLVNHGEEFGGELFCRPRAVDTCGRSIYVACAGLNGSTTTKVKIFCFNNKGEFIRVYSNAAIIGNNAAMSVSPDGKNLYVVASSSSNVIHRVDTATGEWSVLVESDKLFNVNHMDVGPDGTIYTSNYASRSSKGFASTYTINSWTSDGEHKKAIYETSANATGISVDDEGKYLYFASVYGTVSRIDLSTYSLTTVCSRQIKSVSTCSGLEVFGGKIYATSSWGWVYAFDEETLEPVEGAATMYNVSGIAGADFDISSGLSITIR